jgi:homoserine kinase type II
MAVYTAIDADQLQTFLGEYPLGRAYEFAGINGGIENTNYFVTTDTGRYVLTLFERLGEHQLPFYLTMMQHLAEKGVPTARPQERLDGKLFGRLAGKPAALVACLPGADIDTPLPVHCSQVGYVLAQMHLAAQDFPGRLANQRSFSWCQQAAQKVTTHLPADLAALLSQEVSFQQNALAQGLYKNLPASAVHADLFRDNVLFDHDRLTGIIDFYFAGFDTWIYDLAVTVNDWCIDQPTGSIEPARYGALTNAYRAARPLTLAEQAAWPSVLRLAALRFWLSRLDDWYSPRPASQLSAKDPTHFERVLRSRSLAPLAF